MMKVSDQFVPGSRWTSEWDVDWVVVSSGDDWADVKRVGARTVHRVYWREIECWMRDGVTAAEVAAMREP